MVLLERTGVAGFNGIYLVTFGLRMWETLIFMWFSLLKIQINSKKTRFWKEKRVEDVVTLEGLPFNSSMISFHIWLLKKSIHTLQNNFHKLSFPILEWVHTWANCTGHTAQATLMDMKRQISMCLFISMLFIIIKMQFDIDINNDELLTIIWEHCKKESLSLVVCSNVEPKS
jgi:hypothetical protein